MPNDADRLNQLTAEFEEILEARLTELLTSVKAAQAITAQIATTQQEIRVQERLQDQLRSELEPLDRHAAALGADADKLQQRVDQLKDNVVKLRARRQGLIDQANSLAAEARTLKS